MKKFFDFIGRHAKSVLVLIALITVFFAFQARNIVLNADYGAFLPWGEGTDVYEGGVSGQIPVAAVKQSSTKKVKIQDEESDLFLLSSDRPISGEIVMPERVPPQEGDDYPRNTNFLLMIEGEDLYTADILNLIEAVLWNLENRRELSAPMSALDFVTLGSKGTRLVTLPVSPDKDGVWTDEEAAILKERIENDQIMKYYLVGGKGNSIMFSFDVSNVGAGTLAEFDEIIEPLRQAGLSVYTNGGSVINVKVMEYLQKDLFTLIGLCLIVILVVFYLCFRSKRSVLIPMSLSVIGLIWTFGTMAMLDINITILNIVTPCMVLTLGSAYSIHVLSEYYAHYQKGDGLTPVESARRILGTIMLACVTTILGFLCLAVSETEGLVEFGISVGVGIAYCAILACIYLPAILTVTPQPKKRQLKSYSTGLMARLVNFLSNFITRYWKYLVIVFCILIVCFLAVKDRISMDSNYMSYFPKSDPFGQESRHFAAQMGGTNPFRVTITAPDGEKNYFLNTDNLKKVYEFQETVRESPDVLQIISFPSYVSFANSEVNGETGVPDNAGLVLLLSRLLKQAESNSGASLGIMNDDASQLTLTIQHWDSVEKDLMTVSSIDRVNRLIVGSLGLLPEGTTVAVSGDPIVNVKFSNRLISDQNISTMLSLLVVFIVSMISFRSIKNGLLVLVPVLSGVMINYVFMFIFNIPFDMVTVSFSSIAIGCGVDDALHFTLRLKKKRKEEPEGKLMDLIHDTIVETGRPIILTTVSIVCGMMMLSFASYTPIRYFGLLMSISLFGCMISTLIFLPPMIILFDKAGKKFRSAFRK